MQVRGDVELRVLVVDDEAIIADTLVMILKRSGYSAIATYSGEAAVRMAMEWQPAVLVSDVVMPGMSGLEAAKTILQILPDCQVILFSGHANVGHFDQTGEKAHQILAKPVHPEVLLRRLADLTQERTQIPNRPSNSVEAEPATDVIRPNP